MVRNTRSGGGIEEWVGPNCGCGKNILNELFEIEMERGYCSFEFIK
jgi:hypothetical protein